MSELSIAAIVPDRPIACRALTARPELEQAVQLQKRIWGFADIELLPVRLFVVASKIGGQVFGAYDGEEMIAFCIAIPGLKPGGRTYLHSHMLGVLPQYHNRGVGRQLKLAQRDEALSRGIELMEWTFDPLELKNAYFNMERLGAVVRRYVENQYGTTTSPLHGGLPTDRCVAEWWMGTERVRTVVEGSGAPRTVEARIEFPADIQEIRRRDHKRAREIQQSAGEQFRKYFGRGLAVVGFERTPATGTYLLGPWQ
ncbi:MAG TPA: GNAT family N-acetyltransferase [Bryobacteraceae bacterium]|nr:GNAT family N-acetyltransferase [Bryobacteraceae bacterium]